MEEYQIAWCIRMDNRVAGLAIGEPGWMAFRKGWVVRRESMHAAVEAGRARFFIALTPGHRLYLEAVDLEPDADYVRGVVDFFKPNAELRLPAPPRRYEPLKTEPPWEALPFPQTFSRS